uniref:Uncharacterized protein n=1 Tax=Cladosiphon okamuranus TaxID=309737 RepID=A0A3G5FPR1_9PHAE|nr:hypothetical protein Cloka_024 [Cladosiphon okamuranus]AYW52593.1 hypothetical protein Cloka_024 [Cladosiphon okamuranus]
MFTARKRHLRKKRFFLPKEKTFALFNASNLKTSKVEEIKLSLQKAKLYHVPLYLKPPKLGAGYPLITIVYETLDDLQQNLPQIIKKINCLGVSINKKWYPLVNFKKENLNNLNINLLALLLTKKKTKEIKL